MSTEENGERGEFKERISRRAHLRQDAETTFAAPQLILSELMDKEDHAGGLKHTLSRTHTHTDKPNAAKCSVDGVVTFAGGFT